MIKYLNKFLNSKYYDKLGSYLKRKIIRIFKVFFIIYEKKEMPKNNYSINFTEKYQDFIVNNFNTENYLSKNSCGYLRDIVIEKIKKNKSLNLLDFGAGDINTYLELKNVEHLTYFYHDLKIKNEIIKKIKNKYDFKNLEIIDNIINFNDNIDFAFFGSSIGYNENYQEMLKTLFNLNCRYFLFSGTIFFEKENFDLDKVVLKQMNLIPDINYVMMLNLNNFKKFFDENKYKIIFKKNNDYKKINFKNLKYFSNSIEYVDILFEKYN